MHRTWQEAAQTARDVFSQLSKDKVTRMIISFDLKANLPTLAAKSYRQRLSHVERERRDWA